MRILLDACVPSGLRGSFPGHDVSTAHELGWGDLDNGDLLDAMAARDRALGGAIRRPTFGSRHRRQRSRIRRRRVRTSERRMVLRRMGTSDDDGRSARERLHRRPATLVADPTHRRRILRARGPLDDMIFP
jgi:hypothetical protein